MKIGLIGAIPDEIHLFESFLTGKEKKTVGNSELTIGRLNKHVVVVGFSRPGKVSAANMASILIHVMKVDFIIFVGIAGGTDSKLSVGDVVVANELIQYDINSNKSNPYKKFEIPFLNIDRIKSDPQYVTLAQKIISNYLERELLHDKKLQSQLKELKLNIPKVTPGLVGTADQFVCDREQIKLLKQELPDLKCVEMEGAAIAQICHCHNVPFWVIRVISDNADENAQCDFQTFISKLGKHLMRNIAKEVINSLFSLE